MKRVSRSFGLMLAVAVGLVMSLVFTVPASAAATQTAASAASATWDLQDGEQRACIPADRPYRTYFVGAVAGSWDAPLVSEVNGLPEGTEYDLDESVEPGDNGDRYVGTIWLFVDLPPLDHGEYPASLVVTDGTDTQTAPIVIKAQDEWGCGNSASTRPGVSGDWGSWFMLPR